MEAPFKTLDLCWAVEGFRGHGAELEMSEAGEVGISTRVGTQ